MLNAFINRTHHVTSSRSGVLSDVPEREVEWKRGLALGKVKPAER